jgi:tryptophan 2,3-dioxygenase
LTTLTPDEFHVFRLTVGQNGASGFQSIQYRVLEFKLGLKYRTVHFEKPVDGRYQKVEIDVFANAPTDQDRKALESALHQPSIYDAVNYFISKHLPMFGIQDTVTGNYAEPYRKKLPVFNAWQYVYQNRENEPELYQLGEKLVDLEDAFRRWRFAHVATVSRVIGNSTGTGGSTGLRYLRQAADKLFDDPIYPELWDVRNAMFSPAEFDLGNAGY